jgi:hypothetical protein
MALVVEDRVRETSVSTSTGDFTLAGALSNTRRFSAVMSVSDITYYVITNRDVQTEWEEGIGTYSALNTLTRTTVIKSSNANALVNFSAGTKDVYQDRIAVSIPHVDPGLCGLRISVSSTNPAPDDTSGAKVYAVPYRSNRISLNDGYNWRETKVTTVPELTAPASYFRPFDVFGYLDSGGLLALEGVSWNQSTGTITGATNASPIVVTSTAHGLGVGDFVAIRSVGGNTAPNDQIWLIEAVAANTFTLASSTGNGAYTSGGTWYSIPNTRATALATQDGTYVKSGDITRKYLGTAMTRQSLTTIYDGPTAGVGRMIWNNYNRLPRYCYAVEATDSWTHTSAFRQVNKNVNNRCLHVVGIREDSLQATAMGRASNGTGTTVAIGIGHNSVVVNNAQIYGGGAATAAQNVPAFYQGQPVPGLNVINWLEYGGSAGTTTWYGDNGLTHWSFGIQSMAPG